MKRIPFDIMYRPEIEGGKYKVETEDGRSAEILKWDVNAAVNIRNRVAVTVLRDKLLKRLDNGAYEPRKLKRERVKEVLLSFRRSLLETGGECDESVMSTFDCV